MLHQALAAGIDVRIWFVGLESPELHIGRVRARVKAGGHNIPEAAVRARYDGSRLNLIGLLPLATEVWVYDNTADADPRHGVAPEPILLLRTVRGKARSHRPQIRLELMTPSRKQAPVDESSDTPPA